MSEGEECTHLSVEIVERIHQKSIERFGGSPELRSRELLESAVAAAQASFGGKSVFADTIDIAAAYLFYLCSNHAFVDGNKRTALGACLVFLRLNEFRPSPDSECWEALTMDVADGRLNREETTVRLRELIEA